MVVLFSIQAGLCLKGMRLHTEVKVLVNNVATEAWRQAGEIWNAVNSRIVLARIVLAKLRWTRCGGEHHSSITVTIVSCPHVPQASFLSSNFNVVTISLKNVALLVE